MDSGVSVTRWRKYGKDRLYFSLASGEKLGWHDLVTGETHTTATAHADAIAATLTAWFAAGGTGTNRETGTNTGTGMGIGRSEPAPAEHGAPLPPLPPLPPSAPPPPTPMLPPPPTRPPFSPPDLPAAGYFGAVVNPPPPKDWDDLADRKAGAAAREQALALKQAAPVKTFIARALGVHTDERAWRIGADGEERVAARLAKLVSRDPRWRVLHAIPVGERGADIDHLVIGPGGVYSLNAKHHPDAKIWVAGNTFMVNGQRQPYLRNSRHEAQRASRLLTRATGVPVSVTGVVVPVGADDLVIRKPAEGAHVVARMQIAKWLQSRPESLDESTIEAIFEAARRSSTWSRNVVTRPGPGMGSFTP